MTSHSELRSAILSQDVETIERLLDQGADVDDADHDGITSLHIASMKNSSNIVQILISRGASINGRSHDRTNCYTPLHYAVEEGHEAIVKILLSNNADVNLRTKVGMSPLDIAVQRKYVDIARDLLSHGASVNCPSSPTYSSSHGLWENYQPLHRAVENGHDELVKLLIDSGADVKADAVTISDIHIDFRRTLDEWTPLHIAAEKGYIDITKMLLEHGADVNAGKYGEMRSPLCVAMEEASSTGELLAYLKDPENKKQPIRDTKYEIIVNLLLEHGATFVPELEIFQAGLHGAVKMGNTTTVERIFKSFPDAIDSFRNVGERNCTLLHTAASVWNVKSVEFLICHGANVNAKDIHERTPIFYVVTEKDEILMDAPKSRGDDVKTAELLLSKRANLDCIDKEMQTPLLYAVENGNYEMVNFLLMHNACVESRVKYVISPLHLAVQYEHVQIAKVLLSNGASINSVCAEGCASSASNLDKPGSMTGSQGSLDYRPLSPSDVPSYPLDQALVVFNSLRIGSWTPLHCAIKKGHEEFVKLLLSKADANSTNNSTPLYAAINSGHHRIVKLLLDHGFCINVNDEEMKNAMFTAVRCGYVKTIEHVFKFRPDVNGIVDYKGRTLLHKAVVYNKLCVTDGVKEVEVAELLIKHRCDLNARDKEGGTPLTHALESIVFYKDEPIDKMVKCLLEHGARVDPTDYNLQTTIRGLIEDKCCALIELLFKYCSDVKVLLHANGPLLHIAIEERSMNVAKLLIKYGANVNATNMFGRTALHLAAYKNPDAVEMLIENGVDVDCRDEYGKTALHIVASTAGEESSRVMTILLKYGADVNIQSDDNFTALDYALKRRRLDDNTLILLLKHLIKMKAANLFVSQRNLQSIELCGFYKDLYNACKAEWETMRKTKVAGTSLSFCDVLTGIHYTRYESVVKTLESCDYETKFPLYSDWIRNSFERAQKRVNLLNKIPTVPNSLLGYKLSADLSMKIVGYLRNCDLKNLIEAYTTDTGEKLCEMKETNEK